MKAELIKTTTLDRLATWEEVQRATSSTPDRVLELCYTKGTYCEVDSDLGGVIRYPAEEFEFFAFLSEMDDASANRPKALILGIRIWHSYLAFQTKMERDPIIKNSAFVLPLTGAGG